MPALLGNSMKRMQQVIADMIPDLQKLNKEFAEQMKQKYSDKN